jgi:t-SNARE complex subunit (syntaxin)
MKQNHIIQIDLIVQTNKSSKLDHQRERERDWVVVDQVTRGEKRNEGGWGKVDASLWGGSAIQKTKLFCFIFVFIFHFHFVLVFNIFIF